MLKFSPVLYLLMCLLVSPAWAETAAQEIDSATQLNEQALTMYQQGKYQEPLPLYLRALAIREKVLGPEHADTATSLHNLALLYCTLGQYDEALPLYQRAIAIREKVLGPIHAETAQSIDKLAMLYETLCKYEKALPLYQRALAIREQVLGPDHPDTATSLNNLAGMYETLGQFDEALPLYKRSLAIREQVLGPDHPDTSTSLNDLAWLYKDRGEYDKALPLYQRSLAISEKVSGPEHNETAISLGNLAELYKDLGEYDKALPLYKRAVAIQEKVLEPDHTDTTFSVNNMAKFFDDTNQPELALPLFQQAYRSAMAAGLPDMLMSIQANLGSFYSKQDNSLTAIFYLKGAVNSMQSIRAESHGLDKRFQNSLLKKNEAVYKQLAGLLIDSGRLAEAQQVLSMLKEDEYFDFIRRDSQTDTRSTRMNYNRVEKVFAEKLEKLGKDRAAMVEQLNTLNKQSKLGLTQEQEKKRTHIKNKLAEQTRLTIALFNSLPQKLQPTKKQQQVEVGKNNLTQLRTTLTSLGHGAVLLQYLVTDKRVHIILTTPKVQLARSAEISEKVLNRKISEFRRVLQNPARDPLPLAQALYQLLIAPVSGDLKQAKAQTLMLSLDGSLRYLPMAALHDGHAYLAERYPLAMYTEVAKDKLRKKPKENWKAAGFGVTRKIREFSPLPSVQQELDGIIHDGSQMATGGVLPGDIYLDNDFTQDRLHDVLNRAYPVLHIASHFVFIPGTEDQSFLLLGDGKQLSLAELRTGGWKFSSVDLMTLSACETALGGGRDENGREIEGFGALAQRQGAKGVLATLWSVSDQSTAILMQSLYRLRQKNGLTKAEALREAQMALLTGKYVFPTITGKTAISSSAGAETADAPTYMPDPAKPYAHPYYWAPFVLMGNWL